MPYPRSTVLTVSLWLAFSSVCPGFLVAQTSSGLHQPPNHRQAKRWKPWRR